MASVNAGHGLFRNKKENGRTVALTLGFAVDTIRRNLCFSNVVISPVWFRLCWFRLLQVAVGMPVSRHPPHRSQACGTTALGSCLRSDAEALVLPLVPWSKRSTLLPTSVCRSRSLVQSFPWPGAFSPRTPPVVGQFMLVEHLCSLASQILRPRPTSQARSCRTYGL